MARRKKPSASELPPSIPTQEELAEKHGLRFPHSDRHREVLHAALVLFSENGFAGASLRELARRVGVAQPSLYHWFRTKEELLEQVIDMVGVELLYSPPSVEFPQRVEQLPRFTVDIITTLYENPVYLRFLRILFNVAPDHARAREAARRVYTTSYAQAAAILLGPFVERGEIDLENGVQVLRMMAHAYGLAMIEHRFVYRDQGRVESLEAYGETLIKFGEELLASRLPKNKL